MNVKFKQWDCYAKGAYYDNNNKAIILLDKADHERVATATVNIIEEKIDDDVVFVKNYSENLGMEQTLIDAGIIQPEIIHTFEAPWMDIHAFKLTDKALKELW